MAQLSLGWHVARFLEEGAMVPAGPRRSKLIRFTKRQLAFINAVYTFDIPDEVLAIRDGDTRRRAIVNSAKRVIDHAQMMEVKGSGKSPMMAGIAIAELCGPVIPYDFDEHGFLVGINNPDAFCALGANSEEQVKGTTWRALRAMLQQGDHRSPIAQKFDINVGKTRVILPDERVVQYCSASGDSGEGWTISWFGTEETAKARQGNGSIDFIETMADNAGKATFGWTMEATNAPVLGEGSFAERTWLAEKENKPGLYIMQPRSTEVITGSIKDPDNKAAVMEAMEICYGEEACRDHPEGWVNLESKYRTILRTSEDRGRRLFLNEVRKSEDKLADPEKWAAWRDPGHKIPDGARVALGFDGSKSRDSTVIWAVDIDTMFGQKVGVWRKPIDTKREDYMVDREEVTAAMTAAFSRWHVVGLGADRAAGWDDTIDGWIGDWGKVEFAKLGERAERGRVMAFYWNNKPSFVHKIVEFFEVLMETPTDSPPFSHDGDDVITDHVVNMMMVERRNGQYKGVDKASDSIYGQIDGGIAVMLALYVAFKIRKNRPAKPAGGGVSTFDRVMGNHVEEPAGAVAVEEPKTLVEAALTLKGLI